jgi:RNA polymerase sigma-70 factor (ECF subfamily)
MQVLAEPTKELLEECRKGNQQAFKEIFYSYRSYAYNLIYKITGRGGDHADLLQDLFFQVYLSLKTFRGESSFKTWFHRMVVHTCTRRWRYQTAEKRISSKDTVEYESVAEEVRSERQGHDERYELKDLVEKALATLDEKLRIALVLNIYSEMDLSKIAEILDVPEGTVKSRLFTARKKVKEYLDAAGGL